MSILVIVALGVIGTVLAFAAGIVALAAMSGGDRR